MTQEEFFNYGVQYHNEKNWVQALDYFSQSAALGYAPAMNAIGIYHYHGLGVAKNIEEGLRWYQKAAEGDFVEAMLIVAGAYYSGQGLEQDYQKSAYWFERAAQAGNATAMYNTSMNYQHGRGVPQNFEIAGAWYGRAVNAGQPDAMFGLANAYYFGQGTERNYEKSFELYKKAADAGSLQALVSVGNAHFNGRGTEQNYPKAMEIYVKAAESGSAQAMINIGNAYHLGLGVDQDYNHSFIWYKKAADAGDANAMLNVGNAYYFGQGIEQNYKLSFEWFEKAAALGNAQAMLNVGNLYSNGHGVEQDHVKSFEFYSKAVQAGNSQAMLYIGNAFYHGNIIGQDFGNAFTWYKLAADAGEVEAMVNVGRAYYFGHGVEQDYHASFDWYQRAAQAGNATAMNNVGDAYVFGHGVEQNIKKAFEWHRKAAELGNSDAMLSVGNAYDWGVGAEMNHEIALEWHQKAADAGNIQALVFMGHTYYKGSSSIRQNYQKAMKFYMKAAESGSGMAMSFIGDMYYRGKGLNKDYNQAIKWYTRGIEAGNEDCMLMLGECYFKEQVIDANLEEIFNYFLKYAEAGNGAAMHNVGRAYASSAGVKQDWAKAIAWYQKAANMDIASAMVQLAHCYQNGTGNLAPSNEAALYWYKKAADSRMSTAAMVQGGRLLAYNPELAKASQESAAEWFMKAGLLGQSEATVITAFYDFFIGKPQINSPDLVQIVNEAQSSEAERTRLLRRAEKDDPESIKLFFPNGIPALVDDAVMQQQFGKYFRIEDAARLLQRWKTNPGEITEQSCLQVERVLEFYRLMEHPVAADWDACWVLAKAKLQHGQTYDDILKSVQDTGPLYNALSPEGWIMPGKAEPRTNKKAGIISVGSVNIINGEAFVMGPPSDDPRIAKIFPEDIDVALILAFVEDSNRSVRPTLSLEPSLGDQGNKDPRIDRFMRKEFFHLPWLGMTDFGRTFWWTDYLMKEMGSNDYVSLRDPMKKMPYNPEKHIAELPEVLTTLERQRFANVKAENVKSARMMLSLDSVELEVVGSSVAVGNSKMFIDASQIVVSEDGKEDRQNHPNDPTTGVGADAQRFTERYDEVAAAIPAFERLRQLLVLYRACEALRDSGHQLGAAHLSRLRQKREEFVRAATIQQADKKLQIVPRRMHNRSIICFGGVDVGQARIETIRSQELHHIDMAQKAAELASQKAQQQLEIQRQRDRQAQQEAQDAQRRADEARQKDVEAARELQRIADQLKSSAERVNADFRVTQDEANRRGVERENLERQRKHQARLDEQQREARAREITEGINSTNKLMQEVQRRAADLREVRDSFADFVEITQKGADFVGGHSQDWVVDVEQVLNIGYRSNNHMIAISKEGHFVPSYDPMTLPREPSFPSDPVIGILGGVTGIAILVRRTKELFFDKNKPNGNGGSGGSGGGTPGKFFKPYYHMSL